jgi:hypothetical protein
MELETTLSEMLATLDAAETIAWTFGDTGTVYRLHELRCEVQDAFGGASGSGPDGAADEVRPPAGPGGESDPGGRGSHT